MKQKVIEIIKIVLENSDLDPTVEINESTNLRNDLGMDSIALAELTVRIDEEFQVDIFDNGIVVTVAEIYEKLK